MFICLFMRYYANREVNKYMNTHGDNEIWRNLFMHGSFRSCHRVLIIFIGLDSDWVIATPRLFSRHSIDVRSGEKALEIWRCSFSFKALIPPSRRTWRCWWWTPAEESLRLASRPVVRPESTLCWCVRWASLSWLSLSTRWTRSDLS